MPAETILVVSLAVLAFVIFGLTLAYGDFQSRGRPGDIRKETN